MPESKSVKVICPNPRCKNIIVEYFCDVAGRLIVSRKQITYVASIGGHPSRQCRNCGTWIKVPREML